MGSLHGVRVLEPAFMGSESLNRLANRFKGAESLLPLLRGEGERRRLNAVEPRRSIGFQGL